MHIQCENFFFPQPGLSKDFRDKFTDALKQTFAAGELHFHGQLKAPAQPGYFRAFSVSSSAITGRSIASRRSADPTKCSATSALTQSRRHLEPPPSLLPQ